VRVPAYRQDEVALTEEIGQYWPLAQRAETRRRKTTIMAATDADLVRGSLDGSERAFREIVSRYERPVRGLITRMIGDPSRAEELAQDTFVKAFQHLDSYDPERKFSTWLLAIAHHAAIDELRRGHLHAEPLDQGLPRHRQIADTREESPARLAERGELREMLAAAIRNLRPEYAELVSLRYERELTLDEVAEVTGLPEGTVKSSLHRARVELAALLRGQGWRA
jgi:RNA polymerase sigma-70 factor, ECF subfamily